MNDTTESRNNAISLYQGEDGGVEEFPVLKAFQQYIDAEQAKARKRLIGLGIFFSVLMFTVIAVFVALLITISQRNQELNDRLVDYAMKERERPAPVVVQPPAQQDSAAIVSLTSKIEEMQRRLAESQRKAEEAEKARQAATAPKVKSQQELELERLTALIAAQAEQNKQMLKVAEEKAKAEEAKARAEEARVRAEREAQAKAAEAKARVEEEKAEKIRRREAELEAYRRKHYPELYEQPKPTPPPQREVEKKDDDAEFDKFLKDIDSVLNDAKARSYFSEEDEKPVEPVKKPAKKSAKKPAKPVAKPAEPVVKPAEPAAKPVEPVKEPVKSPSQPMTNAPSWRIP